MCKLGIRFLYISLLFLSVFLLANCSQSEFKMETVEETFPDEEVLNAIGRIFYLDYQLGKDTYNGMSPDQAWKTLGKASITYEPEYWMLLRDGQTFTGQLHLSNQEGSADQPIKIGVFDAENDDDRAKIDCRGQTSSIELTYCSYIEVENIVTHAIVIYKWPRENELAQATFHDNITIIDNHFEKLGGDGIVTAGCKNVYIPRNTIKEPGCFDDPRMKGRRDRLWTWYTIDFVAEYNYLSGGRVRLDCAGTHVDIESRNNRTVTGHASIPYHTAEIPHTWDVYLENIAIDPQCANLGGADALDYLPANYSVIKDQGIYSFRLPNDPHGVLGGFIPENGDYRGQIITPQISVPLRCSEGREVHFL